MLGDTDVELTDDLHAAFSAATFALWIATPLVAACCARDASPRFRRWSALLAVKTLVLLVGGGRLAQRPSSPWSGAAQRAMLASALSWYVVAAAAAA
jgi:hypothetical protein